MNWKYCVTRNVKPARQKNAIVIDPLAAVKRRLRNRRTSSIGRDTRRSTLTNAAISASPTANVASAGVEPHPQSGASMRPNTRVPIAALDSTRPYQSMGGTEGSLDDGT